MEENTYQRFLDRVKFETEELREDLIGLPLNMANWKVGDFGCGWGYVTWGLMQEIPNSECIGIDKFDPEYPPDIESYGVFSYDKVQKNFKEINALRSPDFRKGDIVENKGLLSGFDLVYCKRVLYNIFGESAGETRLKQSINHIENVIKPNGWFCFVEIEEESFKVVLEEFLHQSSFEFNSPRRVHRPYARINNQMPYLIYQCKKKK